MTLSIPSIDACLILSCLYNQSNGVSEGKEMDLYVQSTILNWKFLQLFNKCLECDSGYFSLSPSIIIIWGELSDLPNDTRDSHCISSYFRSFHPPQPPTSVSYAGYRPLSAPWTQILNWNMLLSGNNFFLIPTLSFSYYYNTCFWPRQYMQLVSPLNFFPLFHLLLDPASITPHITEPIIYSPVRILNMNQSNSLIE